MYYYSEKERDKAAQKLLNANREAANMYAIIKPVLMKFDGKVYNKRLDKALNEVSENCIHSKIEFNHIRIYLYYNNEIFTLSSVSMDQLKDNKRINAELFLDSAREYREEHLKEAHEIQKAIEQHETIEERIKALEKQLKAITEQIDSYRAKEIYGLNASIKRY